MLKWVIITAVVYMLFRMFQSEQRKKAEKTEKDNQKLVATGELVKDPVCGTYVESASAISVREGETVHRFCSYECRDAFLRTRGKELTTDTTDAVHDVASVKGEKSVQGETSVQGDADSATSPDTAQNEADSASSSAAEENRATVKNASADAATARAGKEDA